VGWEEGGEGSQKKFKLYQMWHEPGRTGPSWGADSDGSKQGTTKQKSLACETLGGKKKKTLQEVAQAIGCESSILVQEKISRGKGEGEEYTGPVKRIGWIKKSAPTGRWEHESENKETGTRK